MSAAQPGAPGSQVLDLSQVSLPRLLFSLLRQRFTGTVVLPQQAPHPGQRTVWFRGGMPVFTDWSEPTEVLGQIFINQGIIAEDALLEALEMMARSGGLLGQTLLAMGRLSAEQLATGLRRQCARKLARLGGIANGQAIVTPCEHPCGRDDGMLPVNGLEVIHSVVSFNYDEARAIAEMGGAAQAILQATPSLTKYVAHFRFRPSDKPALQALVRGTQMAALSVTDGMTAKRAAQLVYLLWACQMLKIEAAPQHVEPQVAPSASTTAPPPGFEPTSQTTPVPLAPNAYPPTSYPPTTQVPTAQVPTTQVPAAYPPTGPAYSPAADVPQTAPPTVASQPPTERRRATAPPQSQKTAAPAPTPTAKKEEPAKPRPVPITVPGIDPVFAKEILALEEKVADDAHAFDLFGLELNATRRDVRRAWGDLSRKFHPDALASQGLEVLRDRVGEAFAALSEAHQTLADSDARAQLAKQIAAGDYGSSTANDATATARAAFEAELLSREGEKLMRANNFARALVQFESAAAAYQEPGTDACIAWCTFQVSNKTPDDATLANSKLQQIIEAFPNIPPPHYFRGFVLMSLGHDDVATTEFTEAYRLDPRLIDAERQARALRQKKKSARETAAPPKSKGKGGLRGLFGKK